MIKFFLMLTFLELIMIFMYVQTKIKFEFGRLNLIKLIYAVFVFNFIQFFLVQVHLSFSFLFYTYIVVNIGPRNHFIITFL